MNPRAPDGIILLPTANRTGSHKILSLSTGKIITRDHFKILPMQQSVIQYFNDMAKKDGRFANASSMINDLTYNQRVNTANMPRFISVNKSSKGTDPATQIQENPQPVMQPLVLADMPPPALHIEPAAPNIIHHDEGGNVPLPIRGVQHELAVPDDHEQGIELPLPPAPAGAQQQPDEPDDNQLPGEPGEPEPAVDSPLSPPPSPLPLAENQRDVIDYFRSGMGVLTATKSDTKKKKVILSGSALETITAVLPQKKRESDIVPSANVSVRDALRTRGHEAKTVIIKELKQIIDRKVWGPIKSHTLTRAEASKVIPSSMFLKMTTNPNGSFNNTRRD
jgi:hypothetical protein